MPTSSNLINDPHYFDSVAGFDTSALFSEGAFSPASLQGGTTGTAIADAVTAEGATDTAGIALIEAAASGDGVNPVQALAAFGQELTANDGNSTHVSTAAAAIAALVQSQVVSASSAIADVTGAYDAQQITIGDATTTLIQVASVSSGQGPVEAGDTLAGIISQLPSGGGDGGGDGGGNAGENQASAVAAAVLAVTDAAGSSLTTGQATGVLLGLAVGSYVVYAENALDAALDLVANDPGSTSDVIAATVASAAYADTVAGPYDFNANEELASFLSNFAALADVTAAVDVAVAAGAATAPQAIVLMAELSALYPYSNDPNVMGDIASEIFNLIQAGTPASDAIAAVAAVANDPSLYDIAPRLLSAVLADAASLDVKIAVVDQLTTLQGAASAIAAVTAAGGTPGDEVSMLAAVAAAGGASVLPSVGAAVRALAATLGGTATVAALQTGFSSLALTADQSVTILAGVGGSSGLQPGSFTNVGNPDLEAAAAQQIAVLIAEGGLAPAAVAADVALALPTSDPTTWDQIITVLIRAADGAGPAFIGSALTDLAAAGPAPLSTILSDVNAAIRSSAITASQGLGVLIGIAASGGASVQAASGSELGSLIAANYLSVPVAAAGIAAAAPSTLPAGAAATLIAAAIGATALYPAAFYDVLATLAAGASATVTGALGSAASTGIVPASTVVAILASVAARSAADVQGAAASEIAALATSGSISGAGAVGALMGAVAQAWSWVSQSGGAGTPVAIAAAGVAADMQGVAGADIAQLVTQGALSGQQAVSAVDSAVTAQTVTAAQSIAVLENAAAGNTSIEAAADAEIAGLVANGAISVTDAVTTLLTLLNAAGTGLGTVLDTQLATLLSNPATLDQTAGLGTPAMVSNAAGIVATLLAGSASDQATAQSTLAALGSRVEAASLTGAQAVAFLLDLAQDGGAALGSALQTLVGLATPQAGLAAIDAGSALAQTGAALAAGALSSNAALSIMTGFTGLDDSAVQTVLGNAIGATDSTITIGQIGAAVSAGGLSTTDALGALGVFARGTSGALQTQATAEIVQLAAADPAATGAALQALLGIASSPDAASRSGGYAALSSFLAANPSLGDQAFAALLPLSGSADPGIRADAVTGIVGIVSAQAIDPSTVTQAVGTLFSAHAAAPSTTQCFTLLVDLLGVPSAEPAVFGFMQTVAAGGSVGAPFTLDNLVTAIGQAYGGDLARLPTTTSELEALENSIGVNALIADLATLPIAYQTTLLSSLLTQFNAAAADSSAAAATATSLSTAITQVIAMASPADRAAALGGLLSTGALTPAEAIQSILPESVTASADFLTEIAGLSPAYITADAAVQAIVGLTTAGTLTPDRGVQLLVVIGTLSTPALQMAATTALANAIVQQQPIATNAMAAVDAAVANGAAPAAGVVTLLTEIAVAQPQATSEILGEITSLIAVQRIDYPSTIAAMADVAHGAGAAGEIAVAQTISTFIAGRTDFIDTTDALVAAVGPDLTANEMIGVLLALVADDGTASQLQAGAAIASLVMDGGVSAGQAGYDVYAGVRDGILELSSGLTVIAGLINGGSIAAASAAIAPLVQNGFDSFAALGGFFSAAVSDGTLTATQVIDLGVDVSLALAGPAAAAALIDALLASGQTTGVDALARVGTFIGSAPTALSPSAAMAIVAAAAAGSDAGAQISLGNGLAALIAGGTLTAQQVTTGFDTAVLGNAVQLLSPTLGFNQAMGVLIGMAGDTSVAAAAGPIPAEAGFVVGTLVGSDPTEIAEAVSGISGAIADRTLSPSAGLSMLAGLASGGTAAAEAAAGGEAARLLQAGTGTINDLQFAAGMASGAITAQAAVYLNASIAALGVDTYDTSQDIASSIGALPAASVFDQVVAAFGAQGAPNSLLLQTLADTVNGNAISGLALGEYLYPLIANGTITWGDVAAQSIGTPAAFGLAYIDFWSEPDPLQDDIYDYLTRGPATTAEMQAIGGQVGAVQAQVVLAVLLKVAAHGGPTYQAAAGVEIASLLDAGTITSDDLMTAFSLSGVSAIDAIVTFAFAIEPQNPTAENFMPSVMQAVASTDPTVAAALFTSLASAGVSVAQIVVAAPFFNGGTGEILGLVTSGAIDLAGVYSTLGKLYAAVQHAWSTTEIATTMVAVAQLCGESATQLVQGVVAANGIADSTVALLVSLTQYDPASYNSSYAFEDFLSNLGIPVGVAIMGMIGPQLTLASALTDVASVDASDDNRAMVLLGMANVATDAQQVTIGGALAALVNGGAQPNILDEMLDLSASSAAILLLAGMAAAGAPGTAAFAGSTLAGLIQNVYDTAPTTGNLTSVLNSAVADGALSATAAIDMLAETGAGIVDGAAKAGELHDAVEGEAASLIASGAITVSDAVSSLLTQAGAGTQALQVATGRVFGTLQNAALATPAQFATQIANAVAGQTLTPTQAVTVATGAALNGMQALATALGDEVGALIQSGQIGVSDALAAVNAADTTYTVTDATGEVALLFAAGGHVASGLQLGAGEAIGALVARGVVGATATIAQVDGAVGAAKGISASQAALILTGAAASGSFELQVAIGAELDRLVSLDGLSSSTVINDLDSAITTGSLPDVAGFAVLVSMVANNPAMAEPATGEVATLTGEWQISMDDALSALFAAAGARNYSFMPAATDAAIAAIVNNLVSWQLTPVTKVTADLVTAAVGTQVISPAHAAGVLLALSALDPSDVTAFGADLPALLANGLDVAALTQAVSTATAVTLPATTAVVFLAAAVAASPAAQTASVEAAGGAAIGALLANGTLTSAQLVADVQAAVSAGIGSAAGEAGLMLGAASFAPSSVDVTPLAAELLRLMATQTLTPPQIFAIAEAVSSATDGAFTQSLGVMIAEAAATSDQALQIAIGRGFADLVTKGFVTESQVASFVTSVALSNPAAPTAPGVITPDAAVLVLASALSALAAGAGITTLLNAGALPVAQLVADIQGAVGLGALSADGEVELFAALSNDVPADTASFAAALSSLVESQSLSATQVFADVVSVGQSLGALTPNLVNLVIGMAASSDIGLQIAVGQEIGTLITSNALTASAAIADINAASGSLISSDAAATLLSSAAATGGPAFAAQLGLQYGNQLHSGVYANQNLAPGKADQLMATLQATFAAGGFSVGQYVAILAGIGNANDYGDTVAQPASYIGDLRAFLMEGMSFADGEAALSLILNASNVNDAFYILQDVTQLHAQVLNGTLSIAAANTAIQLLYDTYPIVGFNGIVAGAGSFGTNTLVQQFIAYVTTGNVDIRGLSTALSALQQSGILAPALEVAALVGGGQITAAQAMAAVDAAAPSLNMTKLVYWLAGLSASPLLQYAVAGQIVKFVSEGKLSDTTALNDIAAITNATPPTVSQFGTGYLDPLIVDDSDFVAVSQQTAAGLYVGLAAYGDAGLVTGAIQQLATLVVSGLASSDVLDAVNAAIGSAALPIGTALTLIADMVAALPSTLSPSFASLAGGYFAPYVASGAISTTGLTAPLFAAIASGSPVFDANIGRFLAGSLTPTGAVQAILYAVRTTGALSAKAGVDALLGVTSQSATAFAATEAEIVGLVTAGAVSGASVVADVAATGTLSSAQQLTLLLDLLPGADAATQTAIGTALTAYAPSLPTADAFFTRGYTETGIDFARLADGAMTPDQAIADIESYAAANNASPDTALYFLSSLLTQASSALPLSDATRSDALSADAQVVDNELGTRLDDGQLEASLAQRVAQGTTQNWQGQYIIQPDSSAISVSGAMALVDQLSVTTNTGALGGLAAKNDLATDIDLAQQDMQYPPGFNEGVVIYSLAPVGLYYPEIVENNTGMTNGYAYDQGLAAQIVQFNGSSASAAPAESLQVAPLLQARLLNGAAETDIVNDVANESMTAQQGIDALDYLVAQGSTGLSSDDATYLRQMSYGWLATKAAEYDDGNYAITTNAAGTQTKFVYTNGVSDLYEDLITNHSEDVATGLGGLSSVTNTNVLSTAELNVALKVAQTMMANAASDELGSGPVTNTAAAVQTAATAANSIMGFFAAGWATTQGSQPSASSVSVFKNEVLASPASYKSYIDLGAQIYATGVPIVGTAIPAFSGLTSALYNSAFSDLGGATTFTVASLASHAMLGILGMNAVAEALGPLDAEYAGVFNITAATADLLGNVVSGVVKTGVNVASSAANSVASTFKDLFAGNLSGALSSAGNVADNLFELTDGGISPEAIANVAGSAGQALVDLASGNTGNLLSDAQALGASLLNAVDSDPFFQSVSSSLSSYANTVGQSIASFVNAIPGTAAELEEVYNYFADPAAAYDIPPPVAATMPTDIAQSSSLAAPSTTLNYANFYHGDMLPDVTCYCTGTLILTDGGEVSVESLQIGDRVITASGVARPIKWIGKRSYSKRFTDGQKHLLPVCIKAGALDDNVPHRDLWISPHHAMYLGGVLIEAKDLLNGVSIVQAGKVESLSYFHVELGSHDLIIAEGAVSESYLDDDNRGLFQNATEFAALHPDEVCRPARYCAQRVEIGFELEAVRRRIKQRSGLPRFESVRVA